jgi:hypothetical protein
MPKTPEGAVKEKVKALLHSRGCDCYYFMPVQSGYGAAGLDFHCVYRGRAFFIETKAKPKGKTPPKLTPRQALTQSDMVLAGARVFIVYDDATLLEVKQWMEQVDLA